jgi:hypothetical protein
MTGIPELQRLGDALENAAREDVGAGQRWFARRPSRRVAILLAAAVFVLPVAAIGAARLVGGGEVAESMPAGAAIFAGTHATCSVVTANVEYHCVLDRRPYPEVDDFKGVVEPTVDRTKHVNGGCRGLTSDGRSWQCYLGQEAVRQQIIGAGFLGEYAPAPGRG